MRTKVSKKKRSDVNEWERMKDARRGCARERKDESSRKRERRKRTEISTKLETFSRTQAPPPPPMVFVNFS